MLGFDPSQCCSRKLERFEAEHWPWKPFDKPVILFDEVVKVFGLNDFDDRPSSHEFADDI